MVKFETVMGMAVPISRIKNNSNFLGTIMKHPKTASFEVTKKGASVYTCYMSSSRCGGALHLSQGLAFCE